MSFTNCLLVILGLLVTRSAATHASIIPVNVFKPGGSDLIAAGVRSFEWNDASNVSIGFTGGPGSRFENLTQSTLRQFRSSAGNSIKPPQLELPFSDPNAYEFTLVSRLEFEVSDFGEPTLFELVPANMAMLISPTISIYIDGPGVGGTGFKADPLTGKGFDDGIEVARAVPAAGGAFQVGIDPSTDAPIIIDDLLYLSDFVLTDVLQGIGGPIDDFHGRDTKNLTPRFTPLGFHIGGDDALYPQYPPSGATYQPNDVIIDLIDLTSEFSTAIPAPSTFAVWSLLGLTVTGACKWRRRRTT